LLIKCIVEVTIGNDWKVTAMELDHNNLASFLSLVA
jgi:hypothetical protein